MTDVRKCNDCRVPLEAGRNWYKSAMNRRYYCCTTCDKAKHRASYHKGGKEAQRRYQRNHWESGVWLTMLRGKAKRLGVPFDLDQLTIPERCPVLRIPLERHTGSGPRPNAPTVDRMVPALGYVKGNVRVISHRANNLRGPRSAEQCWKMIGKPLPVKRHKCIRDPEELFNQRLAVAVWLSYGGGSPESV